eukprot:SAG22_NODE_1082_length_5646_cov_20.621597_3_plen_81_part_00
MKAKRKEKGERQRRWEIENVMKRKRALQVDDIGMQLLHLNLVFVFERDPDWMDQWIALGIFCGAPMFGKLVLYITERRER